MDDKALKDFLKAHTVTFTGNLPTFVLYHVHETLLTLQNINKNVHCRIENDHEFNRHKVIFYLLEEDLMDKRISTFRKRLIYAITHEQLLDLLRGRKCATYIPDDAVIVAVRLNGHYPERIEVQINSDEYKEVEHNLADKFRQIDFMPVRL